MAVVVVALALSVCVAAVGAAPAQDPAPTETPAIIEDPVPAEDSVPGTGDSRDPVATTAVEPAADGSDRSAVDAENRRIWLVVGGLVAVAVALALLTVRYWSQTRPVPVTAPRPDPVGRRERSGRRSRRAVAGADHATADESWEPRGTGEFDRVVVAPLARQARPTPDQRRAAYEAAHRG